MMKQRFGERLARIALLFVLVSIAAGCDTSATPVPTSSQPTASPLDASLTAKEIIVKRIRGENLVEELEKDGQVGIQVNDQIKVEENGRGLLRFQDSLLVEIFHGTELQLSEARLEPAEFIFVRLQQLLGSTRAELNKEADARIRLETEYAVIESVDALDTDTEFVVCHAPAVTCMVTLAGAVEVEAQGQVVTVEAGEATYIFPGQPPGPAICADVDQVEQWMDHYRSASETPQPLGQIVGSWPQEPCTATAVATASPTPTIPPTSTPSASSENMVQIEGGLYEVGVPEEDGFHSPSKQISISGFRIDQYEVSNLQFQAFLDETGRGAPANWPGGTLPAGREAHPVQGVTWDEAFAYCAWANKRLPTESEWEVAARGPGPEPPLYPWGPDPGADEQVFDLPLTDSYEVGTVPFNKSPFDVYDLAGNVWEWVAEPYAPVQGGDNILRGGRHGLLRDMAYRQPAASTSERFVPFAGFRCAADQVGGE